MTPRTLFERAARRPAVAAAILLSVALAVVAVARGTGPGPAAARVAAVLALLGGAVALVRRGPASPASATSLLLEARHALGRDAGVAVIRVDGRRFLVGYGASGAALLAELPGGETP